MGGFNNVLIDAANPSLGVIAFQPPPEMIQEFWVQTAAYNASLGRFAGASGRSFAA